MQITRSTAHWILAVGLLWAQSIYAADAFFDSTHFSGSGNCGNCHNGLFDQQGNDVSIETEWSATMMANSARDPLWRAKFAVELRRNQRHADVLNDKCTRCHTPMANQESAFDGVAPRFFGDGGFADPANFPTHDVAMDGVSCTLCHQIADDPTLGTPEGESGHFIIEDLLGFDRPAYGPYTNPRINPMQMNSVFTPQHAAHVSDSTLCGTCHNLKTPVLDPQGDITTDEFPEQMVYSEWENSAFADGAAEASSCQQCHMARAEGAVKIANRPRMLGARDNFARHGFYGGNTLMLDILGSNRAELDVGNGDFAAAIEATRATLQSAANILIEQATIEQAVDGDQLVVQVRVNNDSGHKLPSSYPSRRVYLHLTVADQDGNRFESGALNPDGSIVGVDADADDGAGYEPHYGGEITGAIASGTTTNGNQVQVYEAIMQDSSGNQTYTLLNAATYKKDNRILPRGFPRNPDQDPVVGSWSDIAIMGEADLDGDFAAGSDLVTYRITLPEGTSSVTIGAELNYQTIAYGYYLDLLRDQDIPEVARFRDMYDASSVRAETIATASAQLDVPGRGGPGNQPPSASFSVSCTNLACTLDGTASADTDGSIVGYAWDFGDGTTGAGATASHTYAAAGTYTVTLTVTDDSGATGTTTQPVTVSSAVNQPPTASFSANCTDLACAFDGTASVDTDGAVVGYAWDFGDGTTGTGATANHTYGAAGTYSVTLTVTDDGGLLGSVAQAVTVTAPAPGPGPGGGPRWRR